MDNAIYGVRRRGIFDSVRLPKGFTNQNDVRNDALTNYLTNKTPTPATQSELFPPNPQDQNVGGSGSVRSDYVGNVSAGSTGAGLVCAAQLWNDAPFPMELRRVYASVNANGEVWMLFTQAKFAAAATYMVMYKKTTIGLAPYGKLLLSNNLLVEFPFADTAAARIRVGDTRILANTINVLWDDLKGPMLLQPMTGIAVCALDAANAPSVWASFEVTY